MSPFPQLIVLVHLLAFTPSETVSKQLPLQRLFFSCFAFSLLALPPPIPTLPTGLLEWDGAGVALCDVFCFETTQAEVHQEKQSSPGLNGGQTAALLQPCRMKL